MSQSKVARYVSLCLPPPSSLHLCFCQALSPARLHPQDWILFYEDQFSACSAQLDNTGARQFAQVTNPPPRPQLTTHILQNSTMLVAKEAQIGCIGAAPAHSLLIAISSGGAE